MSGGVTPFNVGTQFSVIRPIPSPPAKPIAGYFDTSNSPTGKISNDDDILPGYEMPAMPRPGSAHTEGARVDTDTSPAITVVKGNDAAVFDDFMANGVATTKNDDSANANPTSKAASSKLEALRAQVQALSSFAQALLMQIQALNTQVDSLV